MEKEHNDNIIFSFTKVDVIDSLLLAVIIITFISFIYELTSKTTYTSKFSRYTKAAHSGMIAGIITGAILGKDYRGAIRQGAVFALVKPIMIYLGY